MVKTLTDVKRIVGSLFGDTMPKKTTYVFVSGPYTVGNVGANIHNAVKCATELVEEGFTPWVPHLNHLWHLITPDAGTDNPEFWYDYDLQWLEKCDALIRIEGESPGADFEIDFARRKGIPVFFDLPSLVKHYEEDNGV